MKGRRLCNTSVLRSKNKHSLSSCNRLYNEAGDNQGASAWASVLDKQ